MQHRPYLKRFAAGLIIPAALLLILTGCFRFMAPETSLTTASSVTTVTTATEATTETTTTSSGEESSKTSETETSAPASSSTSEEAKVKEDGEYSSKDEVALYIHLYGHLPSNYITKKEAKALGWSGGSLEPYAPGKAIGGDKFGNYEGNLPEKKGLTYHECDIDTVGKKSRGAKRIVFSDDGHIYYTEDHYETFTLLYGD